MNEKQKQILETASETFMRYGVRRTTMSEIAKAAKVSRPTLYGFFASKEELLGGVIDYYNLLMFETIKAELREQEGVSGKLDVVFDHAVLRVFDLMQAWPDASDVLADDNQVAMDAYLKGLKSLEEIVREILAPYSAEIESRRQTVPLYSEFIVITVSKLKKNLSSRAQLETLLGSLKASILCVTGQC